MTEWLLREETPFEPSLFVSGAARLARSKETCSILLRAVKVLDNRRLLLASDVIIYAVTVDGYPDMKSKTPFWMQQFNFPHVKDGATLSSIDKDSGVLVYRGRPRDFLNLYLLVVRDAQSTREFAKLLQDNFVAKGLGTLAGAAVSIFSGLPAGITAPVARELVTQAVGTTVDYFAKQSNLAIGAYYVSFIRERGFGAGLHPSDYPATLMNCGGALEIAYEVSKGTP